MTKKKGGGLAERNLGDGKMLFPSITAVLILVAGRQDCLV